MNTQNNKTSPTQISKSRIANTIMIISIITANKFVKLGIIDNAILGGFIGLFSYILCDFVSFVIIQNGKISDWLRKNKTELSNFINNQVANYKNIKWYKSPRYWIIFMIFINLFVTLATNNYHTILGMVIILVPFIPFVIMGYSFSFILLLLYTIFEVCVSISYISYPPLRLTISLLWSSMWVFFSLLSLKIERTKNKIHNIKRRNITAIIFYILLIIFTGISFSTIYPKNSDNINAPTADISN